MTRWLPLLFCALPPAHPAVKHIYVVERTDVVNSRYERVIAKAHFSLDPSLPANRIITDIDLAPKNEEGNVTFTADLYVLKPRNPVEGNGTVLFEVSNRGRKGMISMFNRGARGSSDPRTPEDFGDRFLLEQGYTLVWLGWQPDVPKEPGVLRMDAPVAKGVTGLVRSEIVVDRVTNRHTLADRTHIPYPAANPDDPAIQMTVRDLPEGPRRAIPRNKWRFADPGAVTYDDGFQPAKFYEVVYTAKDPWIIGLGPAGIRDLISFLKYTNDGVILLGEQSRHIKRAVGFGTSQSGRFLRTFLYYGFNADEKGRKVFDGVWAHVAGAGRGSFNHRFAQPSRDGHPTLNSFYPTDLFPFTDLDETDPDTGITASLLERARKDNVVPKIFYTNGSYEYWGRAASLIHMTPDGKKDAPLPPTTRAYFLTGTQHGPGQFPPSKNNTQNLANPNDYRFLMRGLLARMQTWVKDNQEPPPSQIPRVDKDQLVSVGAVQFPKIPGVPMATRPLRAWHVDFGPEFATRGIVTQDPPKVGKPFPLMLPQTDRDGNETSGIRLPEIQVPLGSYAGWNLRDASIGSPNEIFNMVGSYIPFARTRAEREKNNDPRPSIEERYPTRQAFLDKIREAANRLAGDGFILASDIPELLERAGKQWDYSTGSR